MRERAIVERSDELGERDGQAPDSRATDLRRQARQHLAGIRPEVDDVLLLDGDQVGFVRQEPEERGLLERPSARDERQVLRCGDAAAGEMLAGLPRPPRPGGPEQRQERIEPFLAIEPLVDDLGGSSPAPPSSSRPPSSSASSSGASSRAAGTAGRDRPGEAGFPPGQDLAMPRTRSCAPG